MTGGSAQSLALPSSHSHSRNPRLKKAHHFGSEDLSNLTSLTNGGLNYTTVQRRAKSVQNPGKKMLQDQFKGFALSGSADINGTLIPFGRTNSLKASIVTRKNLL